MHHHISGIISASCFISSVSLLHIHLISLMPVHLHQHHFYCPLIVLFYTPDSKHTFSTNPLMSRILACIRGLLTFRLLVVIGLFSFLLSLFVLSLLVERQALAVRLDLSFRSVYFILFIFYPGISSEPLNLSQQKFAR